MAAGEHRLADLAAVAPDEALEAVGLTEMIGELADDIEILSARLEISVELHLAPSLRRD